MNSNLSPKTDTLLKHVAVINLATELIAIFPKKLYKCINHHSKSKDYRALQ